VEKVLNWYEGREGRRKDEDDVPLIPILTLPDPRNSLETKRKTKQKEEKSEKRKTVENEEKRKEKKKWRKMWWLFAYP